MQTLGRKTTQSPPGKSCQVQAHSINFSTTPNVPCNKQATLGEWGCEPHSGWASLVLFVICAGWGGGRVISRPCCADVLRISMGTRTIRKGSCLLCKESLVPLVWGHTAAPPAQGVPSLAASGTPSRKTNQGLRRSALTAQP